MEGANNRWGISNATSRTNNLNWTSTSIDWSQFSMAFDMEQSNIRWASTVYWGSTSSTIRNDNDVRNATGGYGLWIGRPDIPANEGYTTTGWNFLLSRRAEPHQPPLEPGYRGLQRGVHRNDERVQALCRDRT